MLSNKTGHKWMLVETHVALGTHQFVVRNCLLWHHLCFLAVGGERGRGPFLFFVFYILCFIVEAVVVG